MKRYLATAAMATILACGSPEQYIDQETTSLSLATGANDDGADAPDAFAIIGGTVVPGRCDPPPIPYHVPKSVYSVWSALIVVGSDANLSRLPRLPQQGNQEIERITPESYGDLFITTKRNKGISGQKAMVRDGTGTATVGSEIEETVERALGDGNTDLTTLIEDALDQELCRPPESDTRTCEAVTDYFDNLTRRPGDASHPRLLRIQFTNSCGDSIDKKLREESGLKRRAFCLKVWGHCEFGPRFVPPIVESAPISTENH